MPSRATRIDDTDFCYFPDKEPNTVVFNMPASKNNGLKTVRFKDRELASLETTNGQTLYLSPAPSFWQYFRPCLFPILGFFIPWEITGTGLPDYLANNATQYLLAAPVDGSSWTAQMAVSAVSAQAEADKEIWIAAQGALPG